MLLRTQICDMFDIDVPVVLAGMGGAAGPELAAAVSNAGGLGVLGAAGCPPAELDEWVTRTRRLTDRPFGVDTLLPASVPDRLEPSAPVGHRDEAAPAGARDGGGGNGRQLVPAETLEARDRFMDEVGLARRPRRPEGEAPRRPRVSFVGDFFQSQLEVVLDRRVPVYVAGLGVPPAEFMAKGRQLGMRFMGVAGQSRHAQKLAQAGVDAVVAQGTDGGGHNSPIGTLALIPQAVDAAGGLPVLGAGGISDGRGIAAAFMLGARGVWVGTRFLATPEANIPDYQKQVLLRIGDRDTIVSKSVTGKPARMVRASWAEVFERGEMEALPMPLQSIVSAPVVGSAQANERADVYAGFSGQGVGLVHDLTPAGQVLERIVAEAVALLDGISTLPGVTASSGVGR
ncbi:MAG: nitronate monooxygenase [Acidimicrobiia bacterium]|nr:nitronate monooxygenase [Acidimicrobiia bacterium]